jgi:trimeric autotransporter adhesin
MRLTWIIAFGWAGAVFGQCTPAVQPLGEAQGVTTVPLALAVHDVDGPGPQPAELFASGRGLAAWNGSAWREIATPSLEGSSSASPLLSWNNMGVPTLVRSRNGALGVVELLTTAGWSQLPGVFQGEINAFTTWDADGDGPQAPLLIAAGRFTNINNQPRLRVAAWNGTAWIALGAGISSEVASLATFDPDDQGPAPAQLLAGTRSAGELWIWNGSSWTAAAWPLGTSRNSVLTMTPWDTDGAGPLLPRLVVGGSFQNNNSVSSFRNIVFWNGATFESVPLQGPTNTVTGLTTWDPDAAGPLAERLVMTGDFAFVSGDQPEPYRRIAVLDGITWSEPGGGVASTVAANGTMRIATYDADGAGPQSARVIVSGPITKAGGRDVRFMAQWDNTQWRSLPDVADVQPIDSPAEATVLRVGSERRVFTLAPTSATTRIWRRDDQGWSIAASIAGRIDAHLVWDPDGTGPRGEEWLLAGTTDGASPTAIITSFDGANLQPVSMPTNVRSIEALALHEGDIYAATTSTTGVHRVLRLSNLGWTTIAGNFSSPVSALASFDIDGPGPAPAVLAASGAFTSVSSVQANRVALWNGTAWQAAAQGLDAGIPNGSNAVAKLLSWDPDDAGPLPARLVAGGFFQDISAGPSVFGLAFWNGTSWNAFPAGKPSIFSSLYLYTWDRDGAGPRTSDLIWSATETWTYNLSLGWQPLLTPASTMPYAIGLADLDGPGAQPPLVIGSRRTIVPTMSPQVEVFSFRTCLTCDDIDFNNNAVFPEDQDVTDFFTVLAGGAPASCDGTLGCNDIDFNNNGVFPEDQDVIDFFNVLAGGICP